MNAETRTQNIETEVHLTAVLQKIDKLLGLRYQPHQWSDLLRLLKPAARELGYTDSSAFLVWLVNLEQDEQSVRILAKHLTIGESYFFREIVIFSILREKVLPAILERKKAQGDKHLRIWSAGCSTGEEVYTLAILLDSFLKDKPDWQYSILGTDINPVAIERAREGRYRDWSFRDVPAEIHDNYFEILEDGRHEVLARIKQHTEFRMLNLVSSPGLFPAGFELVFCRNVLMYFTREKVQTIVQGFRRSVTEGGWLIPSLTETTLINNAGFEGVRFGDATLFRKQAPIPKILTFRHNGEQAGAEAADQPQKSSGTKNPFSGLLPSRNNETAVDADSKNRVSAPVLDQVPEFSGKQNAVHHSPDVLPSTEDLSSRVHEHLREARQHADAGRLDLALDSIDLAIAMSKMDSHAHYFRGTILLECGETSQALQAFERTLYLNQDFIPAHFSIGTLHHMLGQHGKARRHFDIALHLIGVLADKDIVLEPGDVSAGQMADIIRTFID